MFKKSVVLNQIGKSELHSSAKDPVERVANRLRFKQIITAIHCSLIPNTADRMYKNPDNRCNEKKINR